MRDWWGNSGVEAAIDLAGIVEHVTLVELTLNFVLTKSCKTS
ncbi:alkyl hydroperoxide reductase subunit F domain protein [Acinetobacter baumannii OIFC180]|nr:alkyl hydroperoxide reductase subunit F domain protein [Acinetobacter baumannii OIFC180]